MIDSVASAPDDRELAEGFVAGQAPALVEAYRRWAALVHTFAVRRSRSW